MICVLVLGSNSDNIYQKIFHKYLFRSTREDMTAGHADWRPLLSIVGRVACSEDIIDCWELFRHDSGVVGETN